MYVLRIRVVDLVGHVVRFAEGGAYACELVAEGLRGLGYREGQCAWQHLSLGFEAWGFSFAITLDPRLGPVNQKSQTSTCQLGDSRTKKQLAALRALRNSFSGCKGVTSLPSTQDIPTT